MIENFARMILERRDRARIQMLHLSMGRKNYEAGAVASDQRHHRVVVGVERAGVTFDDAADLAIVERRLIAMVSVGNQD